MSTPWVNAGPDDAAPDALLRRLAARIPVDSIDRIWIFPTRKAARVESSVFVVASYHPEPNKRRVLTAHFTATRDNRGRASIDEFILEHAIADEPAIERAILGVMRRLGDEIAGHPRVVDIRGSADSWADLLRDSSPAEPSPLDAESESQSR